MNPTLDLDLSNWQSQETGPFFAELDPPETLLADAAPAEYLAAIRKYGGREGFLGQCYLRLFRYTELISLNRAFGIADCAPQLFIFGSDGAEEAYALEIGTGNVFMVPFVPLAIKHAQLMGNSFSHFIRRLAETGASLALDPSRAGLDVCAKQPIVLGGSPIDPRNKILVPPAKHAELAAYWNKVYRRLVEQKRGNQG